MATKRDLKRAYGKAKKIKNKNLRGICIGLVVAVAICTFFYPVFEKYIGDSILPQINSEVVGIDGKAEIHFIDVGQGTSVLVKGSEKVILYDAGEAEQAPKIVKYLKEQGVKKIDYFINSHPHSDHLGGCRGVMKEIPTDNFIMTELKKSIVPTTATYRKTLEFLNEHKDTIKSRIGKVGDTFDLGDGLVATITGPVDLYNDLNESSLVLQVDFGETSFLLTGDMELKSQQDMADRGKVSPVTVMNAGHHGSSTSINKDFMKKANPKYAVISCGKDNKYGHPHRETIELYNKMGIEYYRTDEQGTIVAITDGKNVTFKTEK